MMKPKITIEFAIAAILACFAVINSGPRCFADDVYPTFRKGLWQVDDTMEINGKSIKHPRTKCMDPTDEVRGKLTPGNAFGCVTGVPKKIGNRYEIVTTCTGTIVGHTNRVITVESDNAYTDISDQQLGKAKAKETLIARRIGDCH